MEAPYELISLAVANFIAGMAAYMWGVYKERLNLQLESGWAERVAVIVYFAFGTGFAFAMFPVLLGSKDREGKIAAEEDWVDVEMGVMAAREEETQWEAKAESEVRGRRSC